MATESDPFCDNVSVIVLNYNQAATTVECLEALAGPAASSSARSSWWTTDLTPDELAILRRMPRTTSLVEVGENRFFGEGNNIGWTSPAATTSSSSTTMPSLSPAGWRPWRDDGTIPTSPRWAHVPVPGRPGPGGGWLALPTGDVVQIGQGRRMGPRPLRHALRGRFLLRRLPHDEEGGLPRVGGFGFEWEPAYYEDADLCLKLWTRCGKVVVNPAARVVHIESKTTSNGQLQLHNISEINRARFVAKWGPWLQARQHHQRAESGCRA